MFCGMWGGSRGQNTSTRSCSKKGGEARPMFTAILALWFPPARPLSKLCLFIRNKGGAV